MAAWRASSSTSRAIAPAWSRPEPWGGWSIASWRAYAERKGWTLRETTSIVTLVAPHAILALEPDGTLHTVSLRMTEISMG